LVVDLPEGQQLVVTASGTAKLVVSKSRIPNMTHNLAEDRAVVRLGASKLDGAAYLVSLNK
jgi:hypothetical protein